jgi:hypothetical protein
VCAKRWELFSKLTLTGKVWALKSWEKKCGNIAFGLGNADI